MALYHSMAITKIAGLDIHGCKRRCVVGCIAKGASERRNDSRATIGERQQSLIGEQSTVEQRLTCITGPCLNCTMGEPRLPRQHLVRKKHDADDSLFPTLGMPPPIIEYSFTQDTYVAAE